MANKCRYCGASVGEDIGDMAMHYTYCVYLDATLGPVKASKDASRTRCTHTLNGHRCTKRKVAFSAYCLKHRREVELEGKARRAMDRERAGSW